MSGRVRELRHRFRTGMLGALALAALAAGGCRGGDAPSGPGAANFVLDPDPGTEARIQRVLSGLRPEVRFTNRPDPSYSLRERLEHYEVPGISLAVVEGGQIAWARAFGRKTAGREEPVTVETILHAKSVSKPVVAALTLKLVEGGVLDLDAPLGRMLTSWTVPDNRFTRATPPTLRHVLSHSAGFTEHGVDSFRPDEELPTLLETIRGETPEADTVTVDFEPGTRFRYSGGGYGVLQQLLEDVTGRPLAELADSLVFEPLSMDHSFYPLRFSDELRPFAATGHGADGQPIPGGYEILPMQAAGGLWTTARDLARFVVALNEAWADGPGTIVERHTAREMLTPHADDWGLGLQVDSVGGELRFSHGGSGDGFRAVIVGFPGRGEGAAILANGDGAGALRDELLRSLAVEYDWPAYRETVTYELATDVGQEDLRRLEGTYVWSSGIPSEVALRDGALHERFDEGAWVRLFPLSPTEFVTLGNVRYRFHPGEGDGTHTLEMTDEAGTYTASPRGAIDGWHVVTPRRGAARDSIHFRVMGSGVHSTAGPSALYFHPDSVGRVPYEVGATFTQMGAPGSDAGVGLMAAGVGGESGALRHLLFRVRADGSYAIEIWAGGAHTRTIRSWSRHEAVSPMSGEGRHTNALSVSVEAERLVFSVNGSVVTTVPSEQVGATEGFAGFYVGRAHDVHVEGFGVAEPASG